MTVQLPDAGMPMPVKLSAVWPAVNDEGVVPVQVPPTPPATALIFVNVSVNAPPVSAVALLFANVRVTTEFPPEAIDAGLNALAMVGDTTDVTVRVAVLLAVPAVGVCVVVTPDVVFGFPPVWLLVTLKVTMQLPDAGIPMPVKLKAVWPTVNDEGEVPVHVPPTAPPTALILVNVSVNAAPVSAEELLLLSVTVTTELAPEAIEVGLNDLAMLGDA